MRTRTSELSTLPPPSRGTLLIAGVDAEAALKTSSALRRKGYACLTATTGPTAAKLLRQVTFDALIVEHALTAEDGVTSFAAWAHATSLEIPTVITSPNVFAALHLHSARVEVVPEPVHLDRLFQTVRALIRDRGESERPRHTFYRRTG